jgi:RNA polymerase sigma factor (sigma-70 family)
LEVSAKLPAESSAMFAAENMQQFAGRRYLSLMNRLANAVVATGRFGIRDYDERFQALRPRLMAICRSLAGPDDADDAVQDTYLRGRRSAHQLRAADSFDAWLARIAVNVCYGHRRSLRHRVQGLFNTQPTVTTLGRDEGLRELIERLPTRERTVIVLHYGHGYRLDEIADIVGTSHTNARTIVHRARKRLAAQWKDAVT